MWTLILPEGYTKKLNDKCKKNYIANLPIIGRPNIVEKSIKENLAGLNSREVILWKVTRFKVWQRKYSKENLCKTYNKKKS